MRERRACRRAVGWAVRQGREGGRFARCTHSMGHNRAGKEGLGAGPGGRPMVQEARAQGAWPHKNLKI